MFTYQVLFWCWEKLRLDEMREEKEAELRGLETQLAAYQEKQKLEKDQGRRKQGRRVGFRGEQYIESAKIRVDELFISLLIIGLIQIWEHYSSGIRKCRPWKGRNDKKAPYRTGSRESTGKSLEPLMPSVRIAFLHLLV